MTTTRPHIYTAVLLLAILAPLALAQDEPTPAATAATNTANEQTAPTPQRLLLPEGTQIQGRRAKLAHAPEDNRWFLIFPELSNQFADPAAVTPPAVANAPATVPTPGATQALDPKHLETSPFATPIEILPGRWLTAMTAIVGNQVDYDVDFRVWGEITTYHDRNYILLTWVGAVSLFGQTLASDAGETSPLARHRAPLAPQEPSPAETDSSDEAAASTPIPEGLREILQNMPRTRPIALPQTPAIASVAPAAVPAKGQPAPQHWQAGQMVIDRIGRIQYSTEALHWQFYFSAPPDNVPEPPLILHPCRLVEFLEQTAAGAAGAADFRVSGQVTVYQHQGYLLLRKALLTYDPGNLSR